MKGHVYALVTRLIQDRPYRTVTLAVVSLIGNLLFAFYNGIVGALTASVMFVASAVYYLLLGGMRFSAVLFHRKGTPQADRRAADAIGILLILLSTVFPVIVFFSISQDTATRHGQITMITIATYTFTKITMAVVTAVQHRTDRSPLFKAINAIRYSEIAVSILTMQQSMLVSFGDMDRQTALILNGCTGAGVFLFILTMGIFTHKYTAKES